MPISHPAAKSLSFSSLNSSCIVKNPSLLISVEQTNNCPQKLETILYRSCKNWSKRHNWHMNSVTCLIFSNRVKQSFTSSSTKIKVAASLYWSFDILQALKLFLLMLVLLVNLDQALGLYRARILGYDANWIWSRKLGSPSTCSTRISRIK